MQVTEETKSLAQRMLDYWELENRHRQFTWVGLVRNTRSLVETKEIDGVKYNACNTTMCAAGTAVFLSSPLEDFKRAVLGRDGQFHTRWVFENWMTEGARLLGLDEEEARKLFLAKSEQDAKTLVFHIANGDFKSFSKMETERF